MKDSQVEEVTEKKELSQLLTECHILRATLQKSIIEILEYAKAFELAELKDLDLKSSKKEFGVEAS
jgi:hypothetical protein